MNLSPPTVLRKTLRKVMSLVSHLDHLPLARRFTPPLNEEPTADDIAQRRAAQALAFRCVAVTEETMRPGWSERQTAAFIRAWLYDHGVLSYFHRPLVWFGERTRLARFQSLAEVRPTAHRLGENDVYILDFGPIVDGVACDVSVTGCKGEVRGFAEAQNLLADLRAKIPDMIRRHGYRGSHVIREVRAKIDLHGFQSVHHDSPYAFFGHRLNGTTHFPLAGLLAASGKQTYNEFFLRGIFGQIWFAGHEGKLKGLWAVEPHIANAAFGAKFEELLLITDQEIRWLRD